MIRLDGRRQGLCERHRKACEGMREKLEVVVLEGRERRRPQDPMRWGRRDDGVIDGVIVGKICVNDSVRRVSSVSLSVLSVHNILNPQQKWIERSRWESNS
jgi:hypothetical protein